MSKTSLASEEPRDEWESVTVTSGNAADYTVTFDAPGVRTVSGSANGANIGITPNATYVGDVPNYWWQPPYQPQWVPGYVPPSTTTPHITIKQGHVSSDPTVVNHCPFCGSGALVGRSDGGVDCNICNETFRVSRQPLYSNQPSPEEGAGVESTENDPLTAEDPFEAPAEVPVEEEAVPAEGESADGDDSLPEFMSLRNHKGVPLDEDDFILHHAIRSVRGS